MRCKNIEKNFQSINKLATLFVVVTCGLEDDHDKDEYVFLTRYEFDDYTDEDDYIDNGKGFYYKSGVIKLWLRW